MLIYPLPLLLYSIEQRLDQAKAEASDAVKAEICLRRGRKDLRLVALVTAGDRGKDPRSASAYIRTVSC